MQPFEQQRAVRGAEEPDRAETVPVRERRLLQGRGRGGRGDLERRGRAVGLPYEKDQTAPSAGCHHPLDVQLPAVRRLLDGLGQLPEPVVTSHPEPGRAAAALRKPCVR